MGKHAIHYFDWYGPDETLCKLKLEKNGKEIHWVTGRRGVTCKNCRKKFGKDSVKKV